MNEQTLLSIIIPIYNVEHYIVKCLSSIYSQINNLPIEVILVNDGTLDNSMNIAKKIIIKKNTIIINQKNQGLSIARNNGLNASCGKYIWFVDSDDWIKDNSIIKICKWILEYNFCDVITVGINAYDDNSFFIDSFHSENPVTIPTIKSGAEWIITKHFKRGPMQRFIIKRSFIDKINIKFIPGLLHEDLEYAPRMLIMANNVVYIPEAIYCYLIRNKGSITSTVNPKRYSDILFIMEKHEKFLISINDNIKIKAICFSQMMLLHTFISYLKLQELEKINLCSKERIMLIHKIAFRSIYYAESFLDKVRYLLISIYPNIYKYIKW